jgi:hypothetical protein
MNENYWYFYYFYNIRLLPKPSIIQNKGNQYLFSILKLEEDVQQDILKFV